MVLQKLGRRQEAGATITAALARDPENAVTHANHGWSLLEAGNHVPALEHFREALRLEPGLEWARQGIIEALNARSAVYRLMLRYFFWISRLSSGARWGIILGGYFGFRILRNTARANPELAPFLYPLIAAYFLSVFLTWTAEPLFNLLLRLDRFGRLALSKEQTLVANSVGACLFGGVIGLGIGLLTRAEAALFVGIASLLLMIPVAGTFRVTRSGPRIFLAAYTGVLVLLALLAAGGMAVAGLPAVAGYLIAFAGGLFLFQWIAAFIIHRS